MRRDRAAATVLLLLLIGVPATRPASLTSCGLVLGIVGLYGLVLKLVLASAVDTSIRTELVRVVIAALAVPAAAVLLFLWSFAVGLPMLWSVAVWSGVLAAGATCGLLASWWERAHRRVGAVECSDSPA